MKCQRCGKEMRNTIGGNYICDECGVSINDLAYRGGRGWTVKDLHEYTGMATIPSDGYFVRQGWQCPKCGAILSPSTMWCPFCSRQTFTPTVTCGTSGEYINPNVTTSISKELEK